MKLLRSIKKDVDKDKEGEDIPKLESVEVVLRHWNQVNNSYQQTSKVLFTLIHNKKIWSVNCYLTLFINNAKKKFKKLQKLQQI